MDEKKITPKDWADSAIFRAEKIGITKEELGWASFGLAFAFFAPNFFRGGLWWCPERAAGMGILVGFFLIHFIPVLLLQKKSKNFVWEAYMGKTKKRHHLSSLIEKNLEALPSHEKQAFLEEARSYIEKSIKPKPSYFYFIPVIFLVPGFLMLALKSPDIYTWVILVSGLALSISFSIRNSVKILREAYLVFQYASLKNTLNSTKKDS